MLVFLLLLLVAVQVVFDLYARSAVTAAAWDGARIAAGSDAAAAPTGHADAAAHVYEALGSYAANGRVRVEWHDDADSVVLTVVATNPSFLPPALKRPLGIDHIRRTVRVRIEREAAP